MAIHKPVRAKFLFLTVSGALSLTSLPSHASSLECRDLFAGSMPGALVSASHKETSALRQKSGQTLRDVADFHGPHMMGVSSSGRLAFAMVNEKSGNSLYILDPKTSQVISKIADTDAQIYSVQALPGSERIAYITYGLSTRQPLFEVIDLASGNKVASIRIKDSFAEELAGSDSYDHFNVSLPTMDVSRDGRYVSMHFAYQDKAVVIDQLRGRIVQNFGDASRKIMTMRWNPTRSAVLAMTDRKGTLTVVDVSTGHVILQKNLSSGGEKSSVVSRITGLLGGSRQSQPQTQLAVRNETGGLPALLPKGFLEHDGGSTPESARALDLRAEPNFKKPSVAGKIAGLLRHDQDGIYPSDWRVGDWSPDGLQIAVHQLTGIEYVISRPRNAMDDMLDGIERARYANPIDPIRSDRIAIARQHEYELRVVSLDSTTPVKSQKGIYTKGFFGTPIEDRFVFHWLSNERVLFGRNDGMPPVAWNLATGATKVGSSDLVIGSLHPTSTNAMWKHPDGSFVFMKVVDGHVEVAKGNESSDGAPIRWTRAEFKEVDPTGGEYDGFANRAQKVSSLTIIGIRDDGSLLVELKDVYSARGRIFATPMP